jgi:hypothetical protein
MDDLITWLRAQLDDDERVARATSDGRWFSADILRVNLAASQGDAEHIARWDPARVLRKVAAERRILDEHPTMVYTDGQPGYSQVLNDHVCPGDQTPCTTLRLLALPYADQPGYREEWRP